MHPVLEIPRPFQVSEPPHFTRPPQNPTSARSANPQGRSPHTCQGQGPGQGRQQDPRLFTRASSSQSSWQLAPGHESSWHPAPCAALITPICLAARTSLCCVHIGLTKLLGCPVQLHGKHCLPAEDGVQQSPAKTTLPSPWAQAAPHLYGLGGPPAAGSQPSGWEQLQGQAKAGLLPAARKPISSEGPAVLRWGPFTTGPLRANPLPPSPSLLPFSIASPLQQLCPCPAYCRAPHAPARLLAMSSCRATPNTSKSLCDELNRLSSSFTHTLPRLLTPFRQVLNPALSC